MSVERPFGNTPKGNLGETSSNRQFVGRSFEEVLQLRDEKQEDMFSNPLVRGMSGPRIIDFEDEQGHQYQQYEIRVYIRTEPTKEEKQLLPENIDGIPLRYQVFIQTHPSID